MLALGQPSQSRLAGPQLVSRDSGNLLSLLESRLQGPL